MPPIGSAFPLHTDPISSHRQITQLFASIQRGRLQYDKAIAEYDKAIQLSPDDADTYNCRGRAYRSKGDYEMAFADYGKAIQLRPDFALAYYNRGFAYAARREFEKAIADYDKSIQLDPGYDRA